MKAGFIINKETTLYSLVDELIKSSLSAALRRHNLIVNEVAPDLEIKTDPEILSTVLSGIVNTLMTHSRNSYIRISAKVYSDIMLIHVRDFNVINSYDHLYELQGLQPIARKIGGFVGLTSHRHYETTIAFSFPNLEDKFRPVKERMEKLNMEG